MARRTMKAVVIEKFGDADSMSVSQNTPVPKVGEDEVLIRMKAAGVNELDFRMRSVGWRWFKPPFTLGLDGAGVIESVGEGVTAFVPGDRVYVFQPITGTYAEFCLAAQDRVYKLPDNVTYEEGAVLPNPYLCGIRCLTRAHFKKGESVLVNGASGGLGLAVIQLARGLGASLVVGTAGTENGRDLVKQMGADAILDYKSPDIKADLRETFGPKGVDIIIETNVDVNFEMDMELAARLGRIVVLGKRGKTVCTPQNLVFKETTVMGCALFFCHTSERDIMSDIIEQGCDDGWLKPYVGATFKLDDVVACHKQNEQRKGAAGKTVLLTD